MTAEQLNQGLWAILPEILLFVLAAIVIGVDLIQRGQNRRALGWLSIVGVIGVLVLVVFQTAPMVTSNATYDPFFSGMIRIDLTVQLFRIMFLVAAALTCLISLDFKPMKQSSEYYALVLFGTLGMGLMAASNNILMLYLSLETTSICLYMLAGFMRDTRPSTEAGMKYFLFGAFTSTIMLYGLSLLFGFTGQTTYAGVSAGLSKLVAAQQTLPVMVALVLVLVGFGFKVAAVPFHMWTPDVYEGAPTPITAFISVASKAAGFAVLIRFFLLVFGSVQDQWVGLIAALAVVTMTLGNVLAISQKNIKRMLAYSSIGQAGYVLIGVAAVGTLGTASVLFYLAAYVLTNIAAFAVVEVVTNTTGSELIKDMAGFSRKSPAVSFGLLAAMLSLAGVPPLAGFFGKFYVFNAAVGYTDVAGQHSLVWLAIIGVLNSIVALYYYLIILKVVYVDRSEGDTTEVQVSGTLKIGLLIASIGMLVMGIIATPWYDLATQAAKLLH
ncbi:MAG TPA: NADH-quinone oxidoreductase subunit N [Anaerolineae bacterium]|nr:NADH-quinone oxidoreductase subunit N [Anaerolineae bacterium]